MPELKESKVLDKDGTLVDRDGDITFRMLVCHTAGYSYIHHSKLLFDFLGGKFPMTEKENLEQPLSNQPGSEWDYGVSLTL